MSTITYLEPIGTVVRFPDGHMVRLGLGQHVTVPTGAYVQRDTAGSGALKLPAAGIVYAVAPTGGATPQLSNTPAPSGQVTQQTQGAQGTGTPTFNEPAGSVIVYPDGTMVVLKLGQHLQVKAGGFVQRDRQGTGRKALPSAGTVVGVAPAGGTVPQTTTTPQPTAQQTHVQIVYPDTKAAVWSETKQGSSLSSGYAALHDATTKTLPGIRGQLQALASRPIGG